MSEINWHKSKRENWHSLIRNHWHHNSEITGTNRTEVSMMTLPNFDEIIHEEFDGDYEEMLKSFIFPDSNEKHAPMKTYALAKLCVSLWTSAFSRRLPKEIIANSISPGATPNSNFARHQSWGMRKIIMGMMKIVGPAMGMSGTLTDAAKRYLRILEFDEKTNGKFWVSYKGKMAGPIAIYSSPYLDSVDFQDTVWRLIDQTAKR
jgi:hypothetical protein